MGSDSYYGNWNSETEVVVEAVDHSCIYEDGKYTEAKFFIQAKQQLVYQKSTGIIIEPRKFEDMYVPLDENHNFDTRNFKEYKCASIKLTQAGVTRRRLCKEQLRAATY